MRSSLNDGVNVGFFSKLIHSCLNLQKINEILLMRMLRMETLFDCIKIFQHGIVKFSIHNIDLNT